MADLYTNAAKIIEKVLKKQGSPKSLVINNEHVRNKKKLYALVCESLKYKSVTEQVMEESKLLSREKQLKHPMALVLVYDFLFGKGLQLGGKLKLLINRNKTSLHAALARMKVKAKVQRNEDLLPQNIRDQEELQIPRYVRVNTLKMSTKDVVGWFCNNGYKADTHSNQTANVSAQSPSIQSPNSFVIDDHIPDILVFPPGTDLHNHPLYQEGKIILQDKASCFPAFVLSPPAGSYVIDACAAPGNKTSQLAAIMENKGKIFAFDIAAKRITTMKKLLRRAGEQITEIKNEDFLKTDTKDTLYENVQYILVDPSCSGSGMVNRLDYVMNNEAKTDTEENQRLESLAKFQVTALSHALSFPSVQKVVYSTCSVNEKENEEVVKRVLEKFRETFTLGNALPTWPYRGHPIFPDAEKCVRASPREGLTNGFFLALFTRKDTTEEDTREDKGKMDQELDGKLTMNEGKLTMNEENSKKRKKKKRKRKRNPSVSVVNNAEISKRLEEETERKNNVAEHSDTTVVKKRKKSNTRNTKRAINRLTQHKA